MMKNIGESTQIHFFLIVLPIASINHLPMPFKRPSTSRFLTYTILGLISIAMLLTIISLSTTHWIHTHRIRAGFWKRCHLQPLVCFHAITHAPAALTAIALCFLLIGLISTLIFDLFNRHLSYIRRHLSWISLSCLSLAGLFLLLSYLIFIGLTGQFCYSFYLMIIAQWLIMNASILASYLQGRRHISASTSIRLARLDVRRA